MFWMGLAGLLGACAPYPSACDYTRNDPVVGTVHECIEFIRPDPPLEAEFVRGIESVCARLEGQRLRVCPAGYVPGACGTGAAAGVAVMRFYGVDERTARERCRGQWIQPDGGI